MKNWRIILVILILLCVTVWLAVFATSQPKLKIIACDVGQGDAILLTYGTVQVLNDGGPDNKVLDCLNKYVPFWDRKIELVILSHPQKDHYMGLLEVSKRYNVGNFVQSGLTSGSLEYELLKEQVGGVGSNVLYARQGMKLRLGLIYIDIVWPPEDFLDIYTDVRGKGNSSNSVEFTSKLDANKFSVVSIISLKDKDILLTGDISPDISDRVADYLLVNNEKSIEYIKVPHHGSKNGLTQKLLKAVDPELAIISVGKNNSYGHPNKEILNILSGYGVKALRTDEIGDIILE